MVIRHKIKRPPSVCHRLLICKIIGLDCVPEWAKNEFNSQLQRRAVIQMQDKCRWEMRRNLMWRTLG